MILQRTSPPKNTFPLDHNDYFHYYRTEVLDNSPTLLRFFPSYHLIKNFIDNKNAYISIFHPNKGKITELTIKTSAYLEDFSRSIPKEFVLPTAKLQEKGAYWQFYALAFVNFISHFFLYTFPGDAFFHLWITHFTISYYTIKAHEKAKALNQNILKDPKTLKSIYSSPPKSINLLSKSHDQNSPIPFHISSNFTSPIPYLAAYSILTAIPKDRNALERVFSEGFEPPRPPLQKNSGKQNAIPLDLPRESGDQQTSPNIVEITLSLKKVSQSYFDASFQFSPDATPKKKQYFSHFPFFKDLHDLIPQEISLKQSHKEIHRSKFTQRLMLYNDIFGYILKVYPMGNDKYNKYKQNT